ncbi:hypothetical protein CLV36_101318 [Laceyella sediminis]|nr:hypothetical protein [Laceyella sediminis]PRZ17217.1 hypothetical protein CLV36_101318 [Laceyella sediminis]
MKTFDELAQELKPADPDVSAAWELVLIGLQIRMISERELQDTLDGLKQNVGKGFNEIDFDPHFPDGELRVSLLDYEEVFCSKKRFIEHLQMVLERYKEYSGQ